MKKLFIILYCLITVIGFSVLLRTGHSFSVIENRNLIQQPRLTVKTYLTQTFQDDFENSFKDQFWGRNRIKMIDISLKNFPKKTKLYSNVCKNKYVMINNGVYTFDCGDYLVDLAYDFSRYDDTIKKKIDSYNKIDNYASLYYYFINRSKNFDFGENKLTFDISKYLTNNYMEFGFNNYKEYTSLFYKTDHHWNYRGSYKGYKDIIQMLFNGTEKPLAIQDKNTFDSLFYGSSAKGSGTDLYKEKFVAYKFDIPNNTQYLDGNVGRYGNKQDYYDNNYSKDPWTNHYAAFYGNDYAEVIFDFNNDTKENILILSNSFSNPINELIASHFNQTYVIDLRHYESTFGKKFDYKRYINEHKIDTVLVIADLNYFISDEFNLEGEE